MPLSDPTIFYLSVDEYAGTDEVDGLTTVPTLVDQLSSEQVKALLLETMVEIDGYCGSGWTPFNDEQEFTFPRYQDTDDDGNPVIPRPVALSTRMIADAILQKRQKVMLPHEVESESNLGHSYTKRKQTQEAEFGLEHWPPQAFKHLEKYRRIGGTLAIEDDGLW